MSVTDVERGLIARYMVRVLSGPDLPIRGARHLLFWLQERAEGLQLPLPEALAQQFGTYYGAPFKAAEFEAAYLDVKKLLIDSLDKAARTTQRPEPLASNLESLVLAFNIPNPDAALKVLGLIAAFHRFDQVGFLANAVVDSAGPMMRAVARLVGEPIRVVEDMLSPSSELVATGLLQVRESDYLGGHGGRYYVPWRINGSLDRTYRDFSEMRNALIGDPLRSPMTGADYEHIAEDRDLMVGVLRGFIAQPEPGVNILLYGPPGSGKTELAKVVAAEAGLSLFATGEEGPGDTEANRTGRLADIVFSERLLTGEARTALLFDEMEDVAVQLISRGGSKVYLNRLLETNPVPIVWTSNDLGYVDPAVLRRMTLAVELKRPPASQRKRILAELARRHGVVLTEHDLEGLSRKIDATPAILENAVIAAKLSGGGAAALERAALGIVRAVSGLGQRREAAIPEFDPLLACADQDLVALADRLVTGNARAFSLCLSGPPGTGKSAFARHLARRLGLEIIQKRASDILGMYVGQSEKNIAASFEEAREANAFLVFDEADSLLLDRRDAARSWEISQVNEMLTWMEDHPLPVAFTTNLMERIDTATLRRFTFHVRYDYLDRKALERAWRVFFLADQIPTGGLDFANLTPGDFAKARKQAEMLGALGDPQRLMDLLHHISRGKPDARGAFGFTG